MLFAAYNAHMSPEEFAEYEAAIVVDAEGSDKDSKMRLIISWSNRFFNVTDQRDKRYPVGHYI